ncbi:MAG: hypothetical protein KH149_08170, partial [Clostridiales bacterium]|nr:hypothetical protein [Clostridiales bacterium]
QDYWGASKRQYGHRIPKNKGSHRVDPNKWQCGTNIRFLIRSRNKPTDIKKSRTGLCAGSFL